MGASLFYAGANANLVQALGMIHGKSHQPSSKRARQPIHPAWVMGLFWCLILLVYCLGPVSLTPSLSFEGALFQLTHIVLFMTGTLIAYFLFYQRLGSIVSETKDDRTYPFIGLMLFIGVAGGFLNAYHHLMAVHGIHLASAAAYRSMKAQSLLHGGEMDSGLLSMLAFLMYPAGFVGLVAGLLRYERLSLMTRLFMFLFVCTLFFVAILAGGRSPILLLLLFIAIASYARTVLNQSWMPKSLALRLGTALLLVAFMVYSSMIWSVRAAESELNAKQNLQHAASVWGATPKPYLLALSEALHRPGLTMSILGPVFYLTQSIAVTEKILMAPENIPVLYGGYHADLIAAALRHIPEGAAMLKENYDILLQANIYGYFTGAWGALFIDYGYFSLLAALIWGFMAGYAWLRFKYDPNVLTGVFYVFWTYSILIGFASPPLGFSNSLMVFVWFIVFYLAGQGTYEQVQATGKNTPVACSNQNPN